MGRITVPIRNDLGHIEQLYGRRITDSDFNHHYLKVPHRTIFNPEALKYYQIHLCESVIDTLTLYSNGIENASGVYGTNSLKDDTIAKIASSKVEDVVIAYQVFFIRD